MEKELVSRYADYSAEVQNQDTRTWGVQVVIVRDGMMFVQSDVDAANRVEAHVLNQEVVFPEAKSRLNCAGGGKKENESLEHCALREMKAELGIEGGGILKVFDELPIVACGQIRTVENQSKGALLGVVLAAYEPTSEEWELLKPRGEMVAIEDMLVEAENDKALAFRPTFRTVLHVAQLWEENAFEEITSFVGGFNALVVQAMRNECSQMNVLLKEGIFA